MFADCHPTSSKLLRDLNMHLLPALALLGGLAAAASPQPASSCRGVTAALASTLQDYAPAQMLCANKFPKIARRPYTSTAAAVTATTTVAITTRTVTAATATAT